MIQRIQTIWLAMAALLSGSLLLDWYTGYVYKADIPNGLSGFTVQRLTVTSHFPTMILAVLMILAALVGIFTFRNRALQQRMTFMGILSSLSFVAVNLMRISNFEKTTTPAPVNGAYMFGSIIPILVLILVIMALLGIRKDEKLVRSMDRLR